MPITFSQIPLSLEYRAPFPGVGGMDVEGGRGYRNNQYQQVGGETVFCSESQTSVYAQESWRDKPSAERTVGLHKQALTGQLIPRGCDCQRLWKLISCGYKMMMKTGLLKHSSHEGAKMKTSLKYYLLNLI